MNSQMIQPEGNYYDKYHSSNPIVKWMMRGFFKSMTLLLKEHQILPKRILEAGCGEGEVTNFLGTFYPNAFIDAFDISDKIIAEIPLREKSKTNFYVGNIYTMMLHLPGSDELQEIGGGINW